MAADLDQFQQLLNTLLSTDNDARTQAEVCKTLACLVAVHTRRQSHRQEREYSRSVSCGTFSGEHVADVLSELACGCCNGTVSAIRDPSIGSSAIRATSIWRRFIARQPEGFRRADKYIRARSVDKSKMVSCMRVARARVCSTRHRSRVFRQACSPTTDVADIGRICFSGFDYVEHLRNNSYVKNIVTCACTPQRGLLTSRMRFRVFHLAFPPTQDSRDFRRSFRRSKS